jgi:hypothetical protein
VYARLTIVTCPPENVEAMGAYLRDVMSPLEEKLPGCEALNVFIEPTTGKGAGISLWRVATDALDAEALLRPFRESSTLRDLGITLGSAAVMRPIAMEFCRLREAVGSMTEAPFGRVSMFGGPPDRVQELQEYMTRDVVPAIRRLPGFQGILMLVQPATGDGTCLTWWDSEEGTSEDTVLADIESTMADQGWICHQSGIMRVLAAAESHPSLLS